MALIETVAINTTGYVPIALDPVVSVMQSFFKVLSALLGGLFGLYFTFLIIRFFYDRKILKELRSLKRDIHDIRKKLKIKRR